MNTSVMMFLIFLHIKDVDLCSSNICITWNTSPSHLTLICTIDKMHLRVFFDDPNGNTQADCLPPYTNPCEAYYKNGSISINIRTQKVYFTIKGIIDRSLNGHWRCRHGMRREKAETYISIGDYKGNQTNHSESTPNKKSTGSDRSTPDYAAETLFITDESRSRGSSTAISLTTVSTEMLQVRSTMDIKSTINTKQDVTVENREMKGFFMMVNQYGPVFGGIVIVLSFVSCNFWISRRCRRANLKLPEINTPTVQETHPNIPVSSIEEREIESDYSDYETINEHEIIPYPLVTASFGPLSTLDGKQPTSKRTSISDSHSSSDRSYLDVIDDKTYLNPYQSMDVNCNTVDIHTYSIMTNECTYDIPSLNVSVKPDLKNEIDLHPSIKQTEIEVLAYMKQIPCNDSHSAIPSRIVLDCSEITSPEGCADTLFGPSSHSKDSIENIKTFICDDESQTNSNISTGPNVMSTLL